MKEDGFLLPLCFLLYRLVAQVLFAQHYSAGSPIAYSLKRTGVLGEFVRSTPLNAVYIDADAACHDCK